MKLKSLQISGFKSFCDKALIQFPQGVSAIVGPNGCGKSNIVDALRWVMGEQSVKQLRGKSMEDIIFAGAEGKPPTNMAEVSLTLRNNGTAPEELKDFSEIMVTRRLYRSGESAYYLNKQPCRLKDIHNLFMGSGMGAKTYAVIQQGNIGAITEAGPEERRLFVEEAAGVTRYKARKSEALRKLEATKQNLYRLDDLLSEVKRQMISLKRQAGRAKAYSLLQEQIRELDVLLAIREHDDYKLRIKETAELLKDLQNKSVSDHTRLQQLDAAIEEIKLHRTRKNEALSSLKSNAFEFRRNADRLETELSHLRKDSERIENELVDLDAEKRDTGRKNNEIASEIAQLDQEAQNLKLQCESAKTELSRKQAHAAQTARNVETLRQQYETHKNRHMELVAEEARFRNICQTASSNKQSIKRRLERIATEKSAAGDYLKKSARQREQITRQLEAIQTETVRTADEIAETKASIDENNRMLARQVKQVQALEFDKNKYRSRYTTLKKMEENFEWYKDGVRAVMRRASRKPKESEGSESASIEVLALMADIIHPHPSYETAVEAVLGEWLQYILVSDQTAAAEAVRYLQSESAGRSGFIPVSSIKSLDGVPVVTEKDKRLMSFVDVSDGFDAVVEKMLGHVMVADTIDEATRIWNRNGRYLAVVTKAGDFISPEGMMAGGSRNHFPDILLKKQELKSLREAMEGIETRLVSAHELKDGIEAAVRQLEHRLHEHTKRKAGLTQKEMEAQKSFYRASEDEKSAARRLEILDLEEEQLLGEQIDIDEEMATHNKALMRIEKDVAEVRETVAAATRQIETAAAVHEKSKETVVEFKLNVTNLTARLENAASTLRRLDTYRKESTERISHLNRETESKRGQRESIRKNIEESEKSLAEVYRSIENIDNKLRSEETDYQEIERRLQEQDQRIASLKNEREGTHEKIRMMELEQSQRRIEQAHIVRRLEETYHKDIEALKSEFSDRLREIAPPCEEAVSTMTAELENLRKKIAGFTEVNLGAIKEYDQLQERYDFLVRQRDDLNQAIQDLHRVIRKINRITQSKFMETFDLINEKLKEVFPRLFEGGSAQMILTEPEKPLETGVEFMIHPPGKKLTRMSLLSGGEKALSAIAFVFSIFLIKPASFCLMDEIDAPLDEANVFRFNNLLKLIGEKSQIVMVTHNKRTMEFADMLFGITMESRGISKIVSVNLNNTATETQSAAMA